VIALVALDLWSKQAAFSLLADPETTLVRDPHNGHNRFPLVGEWLAFMHNLNYGAAFGQLTGIPHLLVGLRVVAVVLLSVLIVRTPRGSGVYLTSLVLIVAGAAGNLYDNFFYLRGTEEGRPYGPVRDFIDVYFGIWEWHFPTFNVADSCITVGAVLLLLSGFGSSATTEAEAGQEAETGDAAGGDPPEESATPQDRVAPTPGLD
jgi:signal peptidase II